MSESILKKEITLGQLLSIAILLLGGLIHANVRLSLVEHQLEATVAEVEAYTQQQTGVLETLIRIEQRQEFFIKEQIRFQAKFDQYDRDIQDFWKSFDMNKGK